MTQAVAQPESLLGWMGCLADATRLRLLRVLERHELGVAELCDVLQLPQSTVSRHLKFLSEHGWLRSQQRGTTHLYTLADELPSATRRLWAVAREQTDQWPAIRQDDLRLRRRLRQRQDESQQFFAGAAGQWDKLRDELYGRQFNIQAMLALLPRDQVIADLGCGTGQVVAQLAPHVRSVIGVDNSAAMLKAARRRLNGLTNIELRSGELSSLPIEDQSCDGALLLLALSYVPEPAEALAEMKRILKPAGRAVIVDLLPHDRDDFRRQLGQQCLGFAPEQTIHLMQSAGLTDVTCHPLPPEPNVKGPALFLATGTAPKRTTSNK